MKNLGNWMRKSRQWVIKIALRYKIHTIFFVAVLQENG